MTALKVGIASYAEMKARTQAVARGERRFGLHEPKVWFTSTESFAKVLSAGNRELLRVIADKAAGPAADATAESRLKRHHGLTARELFARGDVMMVQRQLWHGLLSMRPQDLAEGAYFLVWVRGLYGPQPQVWGEDAFYGPVAERERVVLAVRPLRREEAGLPLRELAARYPGPEG